jgi:transposase-like protein
MDKTPAKRTYRKFDETFKREAMQNWLFSGKSADLLAGELGINSNLHYAWRKIFAPATLAEALARIEADQREIRHLREQRDI